MSDDTRNDCGEVRYGVELFRIQATLRATRPEFCDRMEPKPDGSDPEPYYTAAQSEQGAMGAWLRVCLGFADMLIGMGVHDQVVLLDFLERCGAWPLFQSAITSHLLSPHGALARADAARSKKD